jgi:hypothetical protein
MAAIRRLATASAVIVIHPREVPGGILVRDLALAGEAAVAARPGKKSKLPLSYFNLMEAGTARLRSRVRTRITSR